MAENSTLSQKIIAEIEVQYLDFIATKGYAPDTIVVSKHLFVLITKALPEKICIMGMELKYTRVLPVLDCLLYRAKDLYSNPFQ